MERSAAPSSSSSSSGKEERVIIIIRVVVMVVLLGYAMLWIMMPTNIYWNAWSPAINVNLNSTYFGTQGPTLLMYSFPILFVAVLGCVYLHLGNVTNDQARKHRLETWKRPMIVNGPLGIVSGIELGFFLMFIALLIWSFAIYFRNAIAVITTIWQEKGDQRWETELEITGYYLGMVGNICLTFIFFPVARGSSVLPLFGLTSEGSIKYHIWLGHMVMLTFTAHGVAYIMYWAVSNRIYETLTWANAGVSNVAGELSLVAGLVLWATTFPGVRRRMFELFFYTHYFYILFMLFYIFHIGIGYSFTMLPGFYLFLVDRYLRFLQSRRRVALLSARILPCETLELNFSKTPGMSYSPTSILFLNVPSLSKLQWHPFTISSNSNLEPHKLSVIIKSQGSWSKKLYQMLSSPTLVDHHLQVSVEGPYGPASTHFLRHDTLVMVSGGSGIAPFISIIRELIFASTTYKCKIPQVILIASFKNSADLTMLDLLLPISGTPPSLSNLQLKIEAYVTRETQPPTTDNSKLVRAIWFKPHATDAPVSAILGPKSWLWLGAIISSSFVMFLIIIGLITRYYIYPIDKNTDLVFSLSLRAFLSMLVMSMCIAMTASAAVLWNKKQNVKEGVQIQNMDGSTQPDLCFYNADRELESLPHESLVQNTKVHYGGRPDLRRLLFECKGSSVGVLVCGPKKMRHDVAAICSSGLAENLHFESISFSW